MFTEFATKAMRRYLVGKNQDFSFRAPQNIDFRPVRETDLYIHIPFCKNICPYCPYNKIKYDQKLVKPYLDALLSEIEQYYHRIGRAEITSIYIGGGTPTNLVDELGIVINKIREKFHVTGDIYVETNPGDLNRQVVGRLVEYGVGLISLGVQSFESRYLQLLGRGYGSDILDRAIDMVVSAGFKSVNLDLMFALPGQTLNDLSADMQKAFAAGANQITTYPLFSFPYSTVGRYRKLKKVKMPNLVVRRKMYRFIHEYCLGQGFRRVSVWGFLRGEAPRYSSVTRDRYIGLGAGAGSYIPGSFYLNTFSVEEYIKECSADKLPVALQMDFTDLMAHYYWLYWRFYDTCIPKEQLYDLFGLDNRKLNCILKIMSAFRMTEDNGGQIVFTERGAFWLHLMQNYFSLNYINKVWSAARKAPYPDRINI